MLPKRHAKHGRARAAVAENVQHARFQWLAHSVGSPTVGFAILTRPASNLKSGHRPQPGQYRGIGAVKYIAPSATGSTGHRSIEGLEGARTTPERKGGGEACRRSRLLYSYMTSFCYNPSAVVLLNIIATSCCRNT